MYLITLPIPHSESAQLVFCLSDPRADGYTGPVVTNTELESPALCDSSWLTAQTPTARVVGQNPADARNYRLFENAAACQSEGFRLVGPMPVVAYRWNSELANVAVRKAG